MQKWFGDDGTNFGYPPNKYGFALGVMIASDYDSIQDFVNKWCIAEPCKR